MLEALRDDALRVVVTRDGSIYFGNAKASTADLPELVGERVRNGSLAKVFFVVDARVPYGDFSAALDGVRASGIRDIAFLAEEPYFHK